MPPPRLPRPSRHPCTALSFAAVSLACAAASLACAALLFACAARPLDVPRPASRACRQPATTVQQHAWNPARRSELQHALAPLAADATATRVPERLDQLATAWVLARADACRSARRQPTHLASGPALFPARATCQNNVLVQHDALVRRLTDDGPRLLARADAAIDELEDALARCERPAVLALQRAPASRALALAGLARVLADGPATIAAVRGLNDLALTRHVRISLAWGSWLQGQPVTAKKLLDRPVTRRAPDDLVAVAELAVVRMFTRQGDDPAALADFDLALAAVRRAYGDTDLRLVEVLREQARRRRLAGADADALAAIQAALRVVLARRGDPTTTPLFAALAHAQGDLEHRLGDYASAEVSHRAALVGREHLLGREHLATAESLHGLAGDLEARGRLAEAIALYTRAALILRAHQGDPLTVRTYNNLGRALYATREFAEARRFHTAALEIRRRTLGDDHPDTATSLNNLGAVARAEGDLRGAKDLFQQSLTIRERVLGPDHPYTAVSLNNLAEVLTAENRIDEAIALHRRALAIREARFGPDHPETARSQHNLGALLLQRGDPTAAEPLLRQAAATRAARLGPDHPETQSTLARLRALAESRALTPPATRSAAPPRPR